MAKRKKSAPARRRRRVGAVGGSQNVQVLIGVAAGAIAARLLSSRFLATMDPKISALVQLGGGVFLAMQKSAIVKGAGLGMFASGSIAGGQSLKLIAGVGQSSWQQVPAANQVSSINGQKWAGLNYLGNPHGLPYMPVISGVGNPQGLPSMPVISGVGNPEGSPDMAVLGAADCVS